MAAFSDVIPPVTIPSLMPSYERKEADQGLVILHVGGLRPANSYNFHIPNPTNWEIVSVPGDYIRKIVDRDSDGKSLDRAARYVLDSALENQASNTSLAFVAHDIGGSVVKRALVIASQEEHYKPVLDDTHLLIFSGVPNRPCLKNGWLSPLLGIFDSCFSDMRGPWIPKLQDRLAIEHDDIAREFNALVSRFRIISFYEAGDLAATNKAVLSKSCAILGVAQEEAIPIPDHTQLEYIKPSVLDEITKIIDTCVLSHRKDFQDFVCLLSLDELPQFSDKHFDPTHIHVAQKLLSLLEVQPWLTSTEGENKILRLEIGDLDEERLFDSLSTAVKASKKNCHPTILHISRHHQSAANIETGILASLIKQLLCQQPQLYPTVESLFPLVYDAALSRSTKWTQRVLWRCLDTLLLSPRDVDTFLFVALDDIDHLNVFPHILSTTAKTAIRLRIAVTIQRLDRCPENNLPSSYIDVDVLSNAFNDAHHHDGITGLDATKTAISKTLPNTVLINSLQSEGAWLSEAVVWVMHAERPLSVSELNILLTLTPKSGYNSRDGEYDSLLEHDHASLLPQLFPGLLSIVNGTLRAERAWEWDHEVEIVFKARLGRTMYAHCAETCLLYLLDYLLEGPVFKSIVEEVDGRECSKAKAKREAAASLATYAAKHWATYWKMDGKESKFEESRGFKDFFAGGDTVLKGWIKLLIHSSDILAGSYVEELDKVRQLLASTSLSKKQLLEYMTFAYSRPSAASLFDRLLVHGAELGDEQFTKGLCDIVSKAAQAFAAQEVARAIAAAPPSLIEFLLDLPLNDDEAVMNKSDMYLRAMQLGNIAVADGLLASLRSQNTLPDCDHAELVTSALCIAYEYGDSDTATALQIPAHNSSLSSISALHMAVYTANTAAIINHLNRSVSVEACTPTGHTPLLIATQRGLTSLVRTLVTERAADVCAREASGSTSLHFAAQNGFADIVRLLIDAEGGKMNLLACDDAGNTPIVVAVRNGHVGIAKLLLEMHLQNPEDLVSELVESDGEDDRMDVDVDVDVDIDSDVVEDHSELELSSSVAALRIAVMVEATKKGFLEIVQILVGHVSEDEILGESENGFTPLHCAAKFGSVDIVKLICKQYPALLNAVDNENSRTPLHLACYFGQKAVVDELLTYGPDLSLVDNYSSYTPFVAACYAGALEVIPSLLPTIPSFPKNEKESNNENEIENKNMNEDEIEDESGDEGGKTNTNVRDLGVNEAARRGHKEVVEYLLDHGGCPNAVDEYANAALHWAAWNQDCRLMELLLLRRCTIDVKDNSGSTPLNDATRRGAKDCARLLANAGADLNCVTESGRTPLNQAVYDEKPAMVRLLLNLGARLELCPYWVDDHKNLLDFALWSSSTEVVKVLLEFYARGVGEKIISPATALDVVLHSKPDLMPILFEMWPETKDYLRTQGEGAATHVYSIASKGNAETLKVALGVMDKNALKMASGTNGTLLHAAICGGENIHDKVNVLLEHGADPSIIDGIHKTTLNAAAYFHLKSVAQLLLNKLPETTDRSEFMNVAGCNGTSIQAAITGLSNANSREAAVELLELLRSQGAPLTPSGIYGGNLLHEAVKFPLGYSEDAIKWLLGNGVDADDADMAGRRPMHLAINTGDLDLVELVLTDNTTLETRDHQGLNGLHYATLSKRWRMTSKLVSLYRRDDANKDISSFIEAQDVDAWTPLHWACRQADLDIVSYLISDCNADAVAKTKTGWMPWHVAIYHGITNEDYLELLPKPLPREQNELPMSMATAHLAFCDICNANIFGDRYQCQDQQDCYNPNTSPRTVFDMCFKCYANHSNGILLHIDGHVFEKVDG